MGKKSKKGTTLYSRLLPFIKPHTSKIIISMFLALIVSCTEGAIAWLSKDVIDYALIQKDIALLNTLSVVIVLIYSTKGFSRFGQAYFMRSVGQYIIMELRNVTYNHLHKLSLSFFHDNSSAVLMSRITHDVGLLASVCSNVLSEFFREGFTLIVLMGVVFYRSWELALAYIICLPFLIVPVTRIGKKLRTISRKNQEKVGELNTVLHETFTGCKIVKAFGMEEYEKQRFQEENRKLYEIKMKAVWADESLSPLMEFFGGVGAALVLWYGGQKVVNGIMTPGDLISFLLAAGLLYNPIKRLSKMNNTFQQSMAAAERVFEIVDTESTIQDKPNATKMDGFREEIVFNRVNFKYHKDNELVLKDINFKVKKGEMIAFVGQSGAGKSTMMDLIPRFYDVNEGSVTIDGIDLRDLQVKSLRSHIGIVGQETILFNDTIANNIAYGHRKASKEKIVAAAKGANAHDFILELPNGYDTVVGERGVKLSGGQRKRITIARALLKNPSILILDEATSELDSKSELLVQEALEALMHGRTTLVIAHRLSTIQHADKILVIEDGQIVETGTHTKLLEHDGIYKGLYELQFHKQVKT